MSLGWLQINLPWRLLKSVCNTIHHLNIWGVLSRMLYSLSWVDIAFTNLSIASVNGKQHLRDVVFSVLVRFSLYTSRMHHKVKQSPKSTTGMFSNAYMMLCSARDWSWGEEAIGASIMTLL